MITLFLAILLIQVIFFKRQPGVLACGLIGFVGGKPADPWKIRMLFLYNLKRGSDATGICIDKVITKETVSANKFIADHHDLFESVATAKEFTVIGHDRAASSGSKDNQELAHPHGIDDESGKRLLTLAHNGTLTNIHPLSEKYDIKHEYAKNSDSQLLAKIMASSEEKEMFNVLHEYAGTATLLFSMPKYKNTLFVHRDPDRELFMWRESEDSVYISSIAESLFAIGGTAETVFDLAKYTLYKFVKGKIVKQWSTADRHVVEYKHTYQDRKINQLPNPSYRTQGSLYRHDDLPARVSVVQPNGFLYQDNLYYMNGHKYNGIIWVNLHSNEWSTVEAANFTKMFFIEGLLMKDEAAYDELNKKFTVNKAFNSLNFQKDMKCVDTCEYTMYPMRSSIEIAKGKLFFISTSHKEKYGPSGNLTFNMPLSRTQYIITSTGMEVTTTVLQSQALVSKRVIADKPTVQGVIKEVIDNNSFRGFNDLFVAVRIAANEPDSAIVYATVAKAFVDVLSDDNIINTTDLIQLKDLIEAGNIAGINSELDNLLDLYYSYFENLHDVSLESEIEQLRSKNSWMSNEHLIREIDQLTYTDFDDLLLDHVVSDEPEHTRPFLQAVAIELNRLGIIKDDDVRVLVKELPGDMFREVSHYYAIYATLKDKTESCDSCAIETNTDILFRRYIEAEKLNGIHANVITSDEVARLEKLKGELADLLLLDIDPIKLLNKYAIKLSLIQEEYAGVKTR